MVLHFMMLGLILFIFIGFTISMFVISQLNKIMTQRQKHQLSQLRCYYDRLRIIVSELLATANDIDQESKYLSGAPDQKWLKQLSSACCELTVLGDCLTLIEHGLTQKDLPFSKEHILSCCRVAVKLSNQLDHLRHTGRLVFEDNDADRIMPDKNQQIIDVKPSP